MTGGTAIAVDQTGNSWISTGAYCGLYCQVSPSLLKLNGYGTALVRSPLPISGEVQDIAIDGSDNLFYVARESSGLKAVGLHSDGSLIEKSGFDTGTGQTRVYGVAAGPETGVVYIAGDTTSLNFPTTPNAYQPTTNVPNYPNSLFGQGFFAKVQLNIPNEREPLIFIPGVSGSSLDEIQSDGTRRNLWIGLFQNHDRLTLDPNQTQANIIATDAIRTVFIPIPIPGTFPQQFYFYPQDAYRQILERLVNEEHYIEYQVNSDPSRRTFAGCDVSGQIANKPNLFVFAYDWRKSNIENAQALKEMA